eukprot:scaffold424_cov69-Phaeocystis_antarctica.AAC.15
MKSERLRGRAQPAVVWAEDKKAAAAHVAQPLVEVAAEVVSTDCLHIQGVCAAKAVRAVNDRNHAACAACCGELRDGQLHRGVRRHVIKDGDLGARADRFLKFSEQNLRVRRAR